MCCWMLHRVYRFTVDNPRGAGLRSHLESLAKAWFASQTSGAWHVGDLE